MQEKEEKGKRRSRTKWGDKFRWKKRNRAEVAKVVDTAAPQLKKHRD